MARVTRTDLAARIDHTLLRPEATETDVARLCVEAISLGVPAVCVSPPMVRAAIRTIDGARLPVACVMGFPSGAHLTSVKASESRNAVADGAIEIDMVADLGASVRTCNQARADEVAVGTALTGGPPHRSQRAELPHWAPASGIGSKAHFGKRMHDADGGKPSAGQSSHASPAEPVLLAAAS